VLTDKGKVYAMGDNSHGCVLGLGNRHKENRFEPTRVTFFAPVTEIAAGGKHSLARDRKGQTHCWGCGNGGALGQGDTEDGDFPIWLIQMSHGPEEY